MNAPLSSTLIANPSLWRLSLMISADSIDVLARREFGQPDVMSASLPFNPAATSPVVAIEELIYTNPMLLLPFRKVDIIINGGFTLIVSPDAPVDEIDAAFPPSEQSVTLTAPLDMRNMVLFRISQGLYNFLQRTFDSVRPTHSLSVLGSYFSCQSRLGNSSKVFIDLGAKDMNVLVFNQLGLAMASCFHCPETNDAVYYALASANTAGFDFSNDDIRIAGNVERRSAITPMLKRFARHVMPALFPVSALNGSTEVMSAPYPLIIAPLCE